LRELRDRTRLCHAASSSRPFDAHRDPALTATRVGVRERRRSVVGVSHRAGVGGDGVSGRLRPALLLCGRLKQEEQGANPSDQHARDLTREGVE
jgi:hypothetical protein